MIVKWNFALTAMLTGGLLAALVCGCGDKNPPEPEVKQDSEQVSERAPREAQGMSLGVMTIKKVPVAKIVEMAKEAAAAGSVTNAAVKAETWTTDFPTAIAKAMAEHRPLIITAGNTTCGSCKTMEKTLRDRVFLHWVKGTGIYLVGFHVNDREKTSAMANRFLSVLPAERLVSVPHVGVFWPRENGDPVMAHFAYQHGQMPGARNPVPVGEFLNALDGVLGDYFKGQKRPTWDEIVVATSKQIAVATEGEGEVKMKPSSGKLSCGKDVRLTAVPAPGSRLVGWKTPDGKLIRDRMGRNNRTKKLTLHFSSPEGTYTAVFGK